MIRSTACTCTRLRSAAKVLGPAWLRRCWHGACEHAALRGAGELRLDCWAGNERLKRYYLDAGFEARGETEVVDEDGSRYWVTRFAKKVR